MLQGFIKLWPYIIVMVGNMGTAKKGYSGIRYEVLWGRQRIP